MRNERKVENPSDSVAKRPSASARKAGKAQKEPNDKPDKAGDGNGPQKLGKIIVIIKSGSDKYISNYGNQTIRDKERIPMLKMGLEQENKKGANNKKQRRAQIEQGGQFPVSANFRSTLVSL